MKDKLKDDLIIIAQDILSLNGNTDIDKLCAEVHKLYEKLLILKFVENNLFETSKYNVEPAEKPSVIATSTNNNVEEEIEAPAHKTLLEDFATNNYADTVFDKIEEEKPLETETEIEEETITKTTTDAPKPPEITITNEKFSNKVASINDKLSRRINIDLNDRIAFIKHLFGNSAEDYNRVINNIFTFESYEEVENFINEIVKPTYNDWKDKDQYVDRFMNIIEKKFN